MAACTRWPKPLKPLWCLLRWGGWEQGMWGLRCGHHSDVHDDNGHDADDYDEGTQDNCHGDVDGITSDLTNIDTICTIVPSSSASSPFITSLAAWTLRMYAWPFLVWCLWTLKARNMLIAARKSNVGFEDEDEVFQGRVLSDRRPNIGALIITYTVYYFGGSVL